jgi:UPF0271 protein
LSRVFLEISEKVQKSLKGEFMIKKIQIDMNSDVGESFGVYKLGLDEEVIPHITSANIACGFHAGDPAVMRKTVGLAKQYGVEVGAHPGYPDLMGFGRRNVDATLEEIRDYVAYQTGALMAFAQSEGLKLQHVKAHGSLYNMAVANPKIWEAMAEVVAKLNRDIILVVLASSKREIPLEIGKHHGIRIAFEAFPDRAYNKDGSLVSRREKGAVIHDHEIVAKRALKMSLEGKVIAIDGTEIELKADTLCVHGDNPAAVEMVKRIRQELRDAGASVIPMKWFV